MGAHGELVKGGNKNKVGGKGPVGGKVGKGKSKARRVGQGITRGLEEYVRNDRACFPLPQVQGSSRGRGVTIGPERTGGPSHTHPSEQYFRGTKRGDLPEGNIFHVPRPERPHGDQEETAPKICGSVGHLRREGTPHGQRSEARPARPHRRQARDRMSPTYLKKKIEKLMEDKVALLEQVCNLKGRVINLQESRITGRPVVATRNKATQTQQEEFGATGGVSQNSGDLTLLEELSLQEVTMDEVTEAALLEDDRPLQICLDEEEVGSDGPLLTPPSAE